MARPRPDLDNYKAGVTSLALAFPDLKIEVQPVRGQGNVIAIHSIMSGSHLGLSMGFEPLGRSFRVEAMDKFRQENGLMAEHWGVLDGASMMEQLAID